jgi:23S rRNA (guanosine2251-2'-O)-methyltransferase
MSLIYGVNPVSEALKARRVSRLVHERGAGPRIDALVSRAHELRIPIETVDRRALDRMTRGGVHQGVAADLQPLPAYTVEELVTEADGPPLIVVLDGVEDPQNVGAILRSASAAGAHGVVRRGTRPRSTARRRRRRPARSITSGSPPSSTSRARSRRSSR